MVNPLVFTGYSCFAPNGSIFIQWRIFGFDSSNIFPFSNLDPVGSSFSHDGFFAILTNVTNGLQSILTFEVKNEHNETEIICEIPGVSILSFYKITLIGMV